MNTSTKNSLLQTYAANACFYGCVLGSVCLLAVLLYKACLLTHSSWRNAPQAPLFSVASSAGVPCHLLPETNEQKTVSRNSRRWRGGGVGAGAGAGLSAVRKGLLLLPCRQVPTTVTGHGSCVLCLLNAASVIHCRHVMSVLFLLFRGRLKRALTISFSSLQPSR